MDKLLYELITHIYNYLIIEINTDILNYYAEAKYYTFMYKQVFIEIYLQIESSERNNKRSRNQENVHVFTYNVVFEPGATQEDILDYSGIKRIIDMAIEGFSCTAFCYGQTGSGKTHTLTGPPELVRKYGL